MFLPVQQKPVTHPLYSTSFIKIIPNAIKKESAIRLREYALNHDMSGSHRFGSKTPEVVNASFETCLVYRIDDPIYDELSPIWDQFISSDPVTLSFIEPYEIKLYITGDKFGLHNDCSISHDLLLDRKINMIIQLCDENEYEGGDLIVGNHKCPREFGSAIFFPTKLVHLVTPITKGFRFSLIGHAWGPYNP